MHPANVEVLRALRADCCVLANNHVLDWGEAGLLETLETLERSGIGYAGAGRDAAAAGAPAILPLPGGGRVLVFAVGGTDSGVPPSWAAAPEKPGIQVLEDYSPDSAGDLGARIAALRAPEDLVVLSVHWGDNWGFSIPRDHRRFARAVLDTGTVEVVHGHSSHHPRAIEIHEGRPILYGCGDFLNDYEGIRGYEPYRDDLVLMYFLTFTRPTGALPRPELTRVEMTPLQIRNFRLQRPSVDDREWLRAVLDRECGRFGHAVEPRGERYRLAWR